MWGAWFLPRQTLTETTETQSFACGGKHMHAQLNPICCGCLLQPCTAADLHFFILWNRVGALVLCCLYVEMQGQSNSSPGALVGLKREWWLTPWLFSWGLARAASVKVLSWLDDGAAFGFQAVRQVLNGIIGSPRRGVSTTFCLY